MSMGIDRHIIQEVPDNDTGLDRQRRAVFLSTTGRVSMVPKPTEKNVAEVTQGSKPA